jgi:cytidylate kinase
MKITQVSANIPLAMQFRTAYSKISSQLENPLLSVTLQTPSKERLKTMITHPSFQECRGYVAAHMHHKPKTQKVRPPAITISRQAGARGRTIGSKLQAALRAQDPKAEIPWTLFDDNLVQKILEDHNLPADLEKFMPDDAVGEIESSINEILGRHPSLWSLFEKTVRTIVRLSRMGNCIIVGRGGNKITQVFPNVLQVRLIGTFEKRTQQVVALKHTSRKEATDYIKKEDAARKSYMKQHFHCDIDDPLLYDLVINTDHSRDEEIVAMLMAAIKKTR